MTYCKKALIMALLFHCHLSYSGMFSNFLLGTAKVPYIATINFLRGVPVCDQFVQAGDALISSDRGAYVNTFFKTAWQNLPVSLVVGTLLHFTFDELKSLSWGSKLKFGLAGLGMWTLRATNKLFKDHESHRRISNIEKNTECLPGMKEQLNEVNLITTNTKKKLDDVAAIIELNRMNIAQALESIQVLEQTATSIKYGQLKLKRGQESLQRMFRALSSQVSHVVSQSHNNTLQLDAIHTRMDRQGCHIAGINTALARIESLLQKERGPSTSGFQSQEEDPEQSDAPETPVAGSFSIPPVARAQASLDSRERLAGRSKQGETTKPYRRRHDGAESQFRGYDFGTYESSSGGSRQSHQPLYVFGQSTFSFSVPGSGGFNFSSSGAAHQEIPRASNPFLANPSQPIVRENSHSAGEAPPQVLPTSPVLALPTAPERPLLAPINQPAATSARIVPSRVSQASAWLGALAFGSTKF